MADLFENPIGTDGFEFVEFTAPDPALLRRCSSASAFPPVAKHRSKNVTLTSRATSISSSTWSRAASASASRSSTARPPAPWRSA